ncbi:MAG TPA: protein TolR [Pseudomonadales bacterium]
MAGKRRLNADINVVPYIDVMLVLLVIFMITAPLLTQGIKVDLPQADAKPLDMEQDEPLIVSMKADGSLFLNLGDKQKSSRPLEEIQQSVQKVVSARPDTAVLVWADHKIAYGEVVKLMTQLEQVGVAQVGLVTEPLR